MLKTNEGGSSNKLYYAPDAYRAKKLMAKGHDPNRGPVKLGRPRKEGVRRSAKTGKILPTRKGTKSKVPSKKASGKAKAKEGDDDGDDDVDEEGDSDGSGDGEDFETRDKNDSEGLRSAPRASTRPVRSVRLTATKLAPIFTKSKSKDSGNRDDETDSDSAEPGNEEEDDEDEPLTKSKAPKKTIATTATVSNEPPKRRGRPPKKQPEANEFDKSASNTRSVLSMMTGGYASNEALAPGETEDQDVRMESPPEHISPRLSNLAPKKSAAAPTAQSTKGHGRSRKAPPTKAHRTDGEDAVMAEPDLNVISSSSVSNKIAEESRSSPAAASSELTFRASSPMQPTTSQSQQHAPASPRKKRGPYNTKKKTDELSKQTRSVKDLWGAAAAKSAGAPSSLSSGSNRPADK